MSWEETTLGEACELYQPKTISGKEMVADGPYPVFGANGIIGRYDRYNHEAPQLVIGCRGSCGSVHVTDPFSWITGNTMVVKPRTNELDLKFIEYMLRGGVDISETITGAAQPQITRQSLAPVRISYPPLPEQQRIVGKLDAAFAALAEAQAHVERNRANARELFESYLNGVFEGKGDGTRTPMLELCEAIVDCEHKTAPTQSEGHPSIRTPNIGRGELLLDGVYRVSEETYQQWSRRAIPMPGDLILAREAPAGNVAVIPDGLQPCLGQRTVLIKPKREIVRPKYLMYELLSASMQERLLDHSTGATVQHVNMKDIRALPIPKLPSLSEQDRIVNLVESMRITSKQLETTYQQKLVELAGLKKAVLGAAFRGEL